MLDGGVTGGVRCAGGGVEQKLCVTDLSSQCPALVSWQIDTGCLPAYQSGGRGADGCGLSELVSELDRECPPGLKVLDLYQQL